LAPTLEAVVQAEEELVVVVKLVGVVAGLALLGPATLRLLALPRGDELQRLIHQGVQVLHLFAVHARRPLDEQRGCGTKTGGGGWGRGEPRAGRAAARAPE
jgi:hypothetical protein